MAQISVSLRNAMIGQYETHIAASPRLQYRSGLPPANCAAARTGTLGAELLLPADWLTNPSAGSVDKNGTWSVAAAASIIAQHYALMDAAGTTCHEQGFISEPWSATKVYIASQQAHNGGNVYRCTTGGTSAGSGGPSGTGGTIADGTVTWAFVQAGVDLDVQNTSLNAGQTATVNTWTRTQGGA